MTSSSGRATAKQRREFFKAQQKVLEAKRDGLLVKAGVSAVRTAAEARGAPVAEDLERAAAYGDQELAVSLLNGNLVTYEAVITALKKIKEDTYGLCENCGDLIPEARLKAVSEARYCMSCQSRIEAMTGSGAGRRMSHSHQPAERELDRV